MINWKFFNVEDVEWITKFGKQIFEESEWGEGEYDEEKIKKYLHRIIDNPLYMFGIIGIKDDQKAGFMIGHLGEYRFMNKIYARENEICVLPKYRGSAVAMTMMKKFIEWAKAMKAKEIYFEPSTNGDINKFDAMAKRLGMEVASKTYRKNL